MESVLELRPEEVYEALGTSPRGLAGEEAIRRLRKQGSNVLVERRRASPLARFAFHLRDLFSLLLILAGVLAALGGMLQLGLVIFAIVIVNSLLSLFQEWRAEKAMQTLRGWMPEHAKVIRDGELQKTLVSDIVAGDVVVLEEGDRVPADARLVEAFDLWTNNVPLTGESTPQARTSEPAKIQYSSFLEAPNIVFMSTSVSRGKGKGVVFATGMKAQFGQIANLTQELGDEMSPLQREIAYAAKYDFALAIAVGTIFFLASSFLLHIAIFDSILFVIGVMIALVPEGLQVTVSSALAINALKMAKENVLIKRLSSVQTLGSVTVICTDKTGTITQGEVTITRIWTDDRIIDVSGAGYVPFGEFTSDHGKIEGTGDRNLDILLEIGAFCNNSKVRPPDERTKTWSVIGDPTDGAFLVAALKYRLDLDDRLEERPLVKMLPFDSDRKRMTTIHRVGESLVAYTKGAPRSVLSASTGILVGGVTKELSPDRLAEVERRILEFGDSGLRVIAVAYRELQASLPEKLQDVESDMVLVGLVGMKDPPRPEVKDAVKLAKRAGMKVMIITGDYGPTAKAIAQEVGIVETEDYRMIRGVDLDKMGKEELSKELGRREVIFARVSPEQKLRIVQNLKRMGEVVAVTGDGANDAPSLKEADIGVAMGLSGTDVAREAADMVLLDDSFASIVKAVEGGRTIYENIRRFIVYVFSHNFAELIPYVVYAVTEIPLPLLVVQVLAIDLGIDVLPSLALSREPSEPGIMDEPPRSREERLFNAGVFARSLYIGVIIAAGALYGCLGAWSSGGWRMGVQLDASSQLFMKGTTMTFVGIVVAQMGNVLACRTNKASLFRTSWTSNRWIWVCMAAQALITLAIVYLGPLQTIFGTTSLKLQDWLYLSILPFAVIAAEEFRKMLSRRFSSHPPA